MAGLRLFAAASLAALGAVSCAPPQETACGRDCLTEIADDYLDALAANDLAQAGLADDVVFVENVTRMAPGEGLWATAARVSDSFRIVVPDPEAGAVGMIALAEQRTDGGEVPRMVAIRLKVEDGEIVEAEHLVGELHPLADMSALEAPRAGLLDTVPEAQRLARDDMIHVAESYYEALDRSDGSLAPFAADCERQENGAVTTGPDLPPAPFDGVDVNGAPPPPVAQDCVGQMDSARFAYIDSIDNRRIVAVDPERGLLMSLSHFRQSMARGPHEMIAADGTRVMWEEAREPYDLPAAHIFKIVDGEIRQVEAVGIFVPYLSPTGWE